MQPVFGLHKSPLQPIRLLPLHPHLARAVQRRLRTRKGQGVAQEANRVLRIERGEGKGAEASDGAFVIRKLNNIPVAAEARVAEGAQGGL